MKKIYILLALLSFGTGISAAAAPSSVERRNNVSKALFKSFGELSELLVKNEYISREAAGKIAREFYQETSDPSTYAYFIVQLFREAKLVR